MAMNPFFSGFIDVYNHFADWDLSPRVSTNPQSNQNDFFGVNKEFNEYRRATYGDVRNPSFNPEDPRYGEDMNDSWINPYANKMQKYRELGRNFDYNNAVDEYGYQTADAMERTNEADPFLNDLHRDTYHIENDIPADLVDLANRYDEDIAIEERNLYDLADRYDATPDAGGRRRHWKRRPTTWVNLD